MMPHGCPGSQMIDNRQQKEENAQTGSLQSQLKQWPIQLHLISPLAPYYQEADVILAADCVAYATGGFHPNFLKDKSLAIACPKLDQGMEIYEEKITSWIDDAQINTLTVLIMQVPCCFGLVDLAQRAAEKASRKVPIKSVVVGLQGDILEESWL